MSTSTGRYNSDYNGGAPARGAGGGAGSAPGRSSSGSGRTPVAGERADARGSAFQQEGTARSRRAGAFRDDGAAGGGQGDGYPVGRDRSADGLRSGSMSAGRYRGEGDLRGPAAGSADGVQAAPAQQAGSFDLYGSVVGVFQEISKNREGIRAAIARLEATWTTVSPTLDAAGLTAVKVLVSMSLTALRQLSESLIAMADALQVFLASHQGVVDVLKRLSEQFSPQLQAFVRDQVVDNMRTRKSGLKGAAIEQYNERADAQADAVGTIAEAAEQLTRGLSKLEQAHSALMVGFGAATGGAALGITGGTAVLIPPATPAAPAVYVSVISGTVSLIAALGSSYLSARDDILGGIQKISELPTVASGQWPRATSGMGATTTAGHTAAAGRATTAGHTTAAGRATTAGRTAAAGSTAAPVGYGAGGASTGGRGGVRTRESALSQERKG